MLDFMVLSAPRSGSTWTANWLTTDKTYCVHDPILEYKSTEMDAIPAYDKMLGIACTGLALMPSFVNDHPARKVIVHRDLRDVNLSMLKIGLTELDPVWDTALERLQGMHVGYPDLFDEGPARAIWEYLTGLPFDANRHARLRRMKIVPHHPRVPVFDECARDFRQRIERALR